MKVCVIIPAAGRSERFGSGDKLSQDLGERPLLVRTVEVFAKRDDVHTILVAAPPEDEEHAAFKERFAATLAFLGVRIVTGRRESRAHTIAAALEEVPDEATHVAVHDAARPAAGPRLVDRVFEAACVADAVVPVLDIHATVKRVATQETALARADEDARLADLVLGEETRDAVPSRLVEETLDRRGLVIAQTPQIFTTALLRRAYQEVDLDGVTDDAMVVERLGVPVHAVPGDPANIKVTTPDDLDFVRRLMRAAGAPNRIDHF